MWVAQKHFEANFHTLGHKITRASDVTAVGKSNSTKCGFLIVVSETTEKTKSKREQNFRR